ncbi:DNA alkylation repair protein [Sphaerochaeta sp. S2]|uniref:DNA alkylation repair protein n=1 Tax=Sphaerochaeta sp. S2 TaxID=2798868 RepID=UPI0018EA2C45|nr:DNA alkylation repair protein [Sphaerochaeta sp. S2]MBJ2356718.1 DNA alkylation repair protein [Sphaerochaeta sp. S2]
MNRTALIERLSELAEPSYRSFQLKLQISNGVVYGVRAPALQRLAKHIASKQDIHLFTELLRCDSLSYEETIILYKLFGLMSLTEEERFAYLPKMLPYNNSWATNDCLASEMKWIRKNRDFYYPYFNALLEKEYPYDKRLGIVTLMLYFLEPDTFGEVLKKLSTAESDHYYVMMALAWAYATAYCKDKERTLPYLHSGILAEKVRKKAIQKCIESRLVSDEDKTRLKALRQAP